MEALAVRLSQLDSHADGAIRVIMFYDTLIRRRVDLPALARASAGLAECVAGMRLHGTGRVIRVAPDGREASAPPAPASAMTPITLDEEEIGTVWLERPGPPGSLDLDELLLDRLAIAAAAVVERYAPARTTMADPALVELVISADSDEAARARALRLLGFAADLPVHVVAVRSQLPLDRVGVLLCPARPVKAAPLADVGVILATTVDRTHVPASVRAGIGASESPDRSWREARTALRFTTPRRPVVHYDGLGALALLAQVPRDAARDNADVAAIARLVGDPGAPGDPETLETLETYCAAGSLRRAAELLHLHHSSVARRLEQIGKTLDLDLTEPTGLLRVRVALAAWRLLDD
ncbi:PucR C-terminal helix-turn-helix domain-containing protein [Streptomyces sp. 2112.3]|uniref:PucR family transcriptional regulator n=1 Tax=Streptomyces sp. 2112.3 TaxID=1881023 RepID=UPI000899D2C8|nr:helix-turn-helix domain-containing protein [Streptomyces sp. 2112.3]SEE46250.1 PucR C-terminal helix-turn-helix domain-containing protein [Streptomyces sp. 2112.3]